MTGLKGLLKKKERIDASANTSSQNHLAAAPEFVFIRSTTDLQEEIHPPDHQERHEPHALAPQSGSKEKNKREFAFRTSANAEHTNDPTARRDHDLSEQSNVKDRPPSREHRLSAFLHRRSRSRSTSRSEAPSSVLPQELGEAPPVPSISVTDSIGTDERTLEQEAQWEKRATMLASQSNILGNRNSGRPTSARSSTHARSRSPSISDARGDVNIQEAIRLHEAGDLATSTRMFGRLADQDGDNNALAQVLYGLALRHGWGIEVDAEKAITYLSLAAENAASVEQEALAAGATKGGAAKGELVLAIYELANCLRNGWGVKKDAVAARQYYETAANLGDTDAMEQAAQCHLDGVGGPKDKFKAAQYLRLAEKKGSKTVGNSWIWKDKYNPK